jgi:AcrR family transcriptional regulator
VRAPEKERAKPRRREAPAVRRAQILTAARTCFAQAGFKTTSVDDIAEEAGVSVGLLYRLFASKTAIIEAIIADQIEAQIAQAYEIIAASPNTGIDRAKVLRILGETSFDLQSLALTFEIAAEACRDPALRSFMQNRRATLYDQLIARLTRGGRSAKTAARMFAELEVIGAVASGAVIQSLSNPGRSVSEAIRATFLTLREK